MSFVIVPVRHFPGDTPTGHWKFEVGHYVPVSGEWVKIHTFRERHDAAVYVNYLNGGISEIPLRVSLTDYHALGNDEGIAPERITEQGQMVPSDE